MAKKGKTRVSASAPAASATTATTTANDSQNINPFFFTYIKPDVYTLIKDVAQPPLGLERARVYSPINEVFLELNGTNACSATFNYDIIGKALMATEEEGGKEHVGGFVSLLCDDRINGRQVERPSFIKFSPLIDPIRYLVGKYDIEDAGLKELPLYNSTSAHKKSRDHDNASYVDGLFSFLSSKMLHHHGFLNALDCYGTLTGVKRSFTIDAIDDIDYLLENDFFIKNNNVLYETNNEFHNQVVNHGSRKNKCAIKIHNDDGQDDMEVDIEADDTITGCENVVNDNRVLTLNDIGDISEIEELGGDVVPKKRSRSGSISQGEGEGDRRSKSSSGSSSCSSRTSHTSNQSGSRGDDGESHSNSTRTGTGSEHTGSDGSESTASEDSAFIQIREFPVSAIFLEECEGTLDYLCAEDEEFGNEELCAALMQVIMSLIAFHKCFDFQHNDLHTNNVMYVSTKKQFLYYKVNGNHYKVPTYGRIFKVIDFGRATFKFRGNQLCSDSFQKEGDAHGQFNFGRCRNPARPLLEPNNSFDLCRLGTSLIDFLIEELEDIESTKDPVTIMIADWCKDDRGRNILWKANGEERYPGFKLYKMISRTVSKHTPISQLERPILDRYRTGKKNIKKGTAIMNIDSLPSYADVAPKV